MKDYGMKSDKMMKADKMVKMDRMSDKPMMGITQEMGHASKVYKVDTMQCMKKYDHPYVK